MSEEERRSGDNTYASSNDLMAFLMLSAPGASVPYGSLEEPEMLLCSDTRSDSSLFNEGRKGEANDARRGHVSGAAGRSDQNTWSHSRAPE